MTLWKAVGHRARLTEGVNLSGSRDRGGRNRNGSDCAFWSRDRVNAPLTLKKTPLHALHGELGAKMVPFAGYDMPVHIRSA